MRKSTPAVLLAGLVLAGLVLAGLVLAVDRGAQPPVLPRRLAGNGLGPAGYRFHREPEGDRKAEEGEREDGAYLREYWHWYERSLPGGFIPPGAEHAARSRAAAFRSQEATLLASGSPHRRRFLSRASWKELGPRGLLQHPFYGPGLVGGRVMALLVQKQKARMLIGSASGGIWKREFKPGAQAEPVSDDAPSLSIGALAADPRNPDVLYAGTGEPGISVDSFTGSGILRSTDGGDSWSRVDDGTFDSSKISGLWVDPASQRRILASALGRGLFESRDWGHTWRRLISGGGVGFAVSPGDRKLILFSDSAPAPYTKPTRSPQPTEVWRSTDGGASFARVRGPWQTPDVENGRIDLAFAPSDPKIVWAFVAPNPDLDKDPQAGLYRSADAGRTWARAFPYMTEPPLSQEYEQQGWYDNSLAVSPADPDTVYFGAVNLYQAHYPDQVKQVVHWNAEETSLPSTHADFHALVFDPDDARTLYTGNDGGVWVTHDGGVSWRGVNEGLGTLQFYYGAAGRNSGLQTLLGGMQDNATGRPDLGRQWKMVYYGDGMQCAVDPQDDRVAYVTTQFNFYALSRDRGETFADLVELTLPEDERYTFFTPLAIDPTDPTRIYTGAQRLYRATSNRADTITPWEPTSAARIFTADVIRRIAPSASDPATLYVSGGPHLARSGDAGATWSDVSPPGGAVRDRCGRASHGRALCRLQPLGVLGRAGRPLSRRRRDLGGPDRQPAQRAGQ